MTGDIVLSCNENIITRMYDLNVHYAAESVDLVRARTTFANHEANSPQGG